MTEQSKKSEAQEYWKEWSKITRLFHANETRSLGFSESMLFASDYANEQNKELKEENERLKDHYLDTDIDIAYLTKEIEQLKNRVKELEEELEVYKPWTKRN